MNFIKTNFFLNWLKFVFIIFIFFFSKSFYAQCANPGASTSICQGTTSAAMGGSLFSPATGGTWSGGAGTWTDPTDVTNARYTAGASESGSITLTLSTSGGSCVPVTFTKSINNLSNDLGKAIRFQLPDAEVLWVPIMQRAFIKEIPVNRNKPIFLGIIFGFFISLLFMSKKIITRVFN